jgi:hypothetical protein
MSTYEDDSRRSNALRGDIAGAIGTPDAIEASAVNKPRLDPAVDPTARYVRGIEWVRPTDLLVRGGSRVAGAGIDFHADLGRRAREAAASGTHAMSPRAKRLPPVSAFGRPSGRHRMDRGGAGMS